jgi:hypothetical protein
MLERWGELSPGQRQRLLGGGAIVLVVLVLLGMLACLANSPAPAPTATPNPSPTPSSRPPTPSPPPLPPSPTPSASPSPSAPSGFAPLDGLAADPSLANRLPLAVMVDDNVRTRPQAGYTHASIVYQAPNDGGEDRYMLIFQGQDSALVGNVRSTRPYFAAWASEYGAALGHYGGDWTALRIVREMNGRFLYDIDALSGAGAAYYRDRSAGVAPFNAFTSTDRIRSAARARGAPELMSGALALRPFADDLPAEERPSSGSINVPYRRGDTSYRYEPDTNSYLRFVAGRPQVDLLDGSRVSARNVIVQFVRLTYDPIERHHRVQMDYIGRGRAIVFRDGLAIEGTWRKSGRSELTRFFDESGNEIGLVRGSIFIQVVATNAAVTYNIGE